MIRSALTVLIFLASAALGQPFVCGFGLDDDTQGAAAKAPNPPSETEEFFQKDDRSFLIVFGRYADKTLAGGTTQEAPQPYTLNASGRVPLRSGPSRSPLDFLDRTVPGSFAHYMYEMSNGKLRLSGDIAPLWYKAKLPDAASYAGTSITGPLTTIAEEILDKAEMDSRVSYDDYDGLIAVIPKTGSIAGGTIFVGGYEIASGGSKQTLVVSGGKFDEMVGVMVHEYGHIMGLPELFDRTHMNFEFRRRKEHRERERADPLAPDSRSSDRIDAEEIADLKLSSAGLGTWVVMAGGARGWEWPSAVQDDPDGKILYDQHLGPQPMMAWSREYLGWLEEEVINTNSTVTVQELSEKTVAHRIDIAGTSQFFLFDNRQNTYGDDDPSIGSLYSNHDPASGLAIWHVDENSGFRTSDFNEWEQRKGVDMESPDPLYAGHTGSELDVETGVDDMDRSHGVKDATSKRLEEREQKFNGNSGDATDLWDGNAVARRRNFTPHTNPSTHGYEPWDRPARNERFANAHITAANDTLYEGQGSPQNVFSGIYIENIRDNDDGSMAFDVIFAPMVPENLETLGGSRKVELVWDAPANADIALASYTINYRSKPAAPVKPPVERGPRIPEWMSITDIDADKTNYVVTGLENGQAYEFELCGVGNAYTRSDDHTYSAKKGAVVRAEGTPMPSMMTGPANRAVDEVKASSSNTVWDVSLGRYELASGTGWVLKSDDTGMTDAK